MGKRRKAKSRTRMNEDMSVYETAREGQQGQRGDVRDVFTSSPPPSVQDQLEEEGEEADSEQEREDEGNHEVRCLARLLEPI
jgi:ribosome maturation protein Sdo1